MKNGKMVQKHTYAVARRDPPWEASSLSAKVWWITCNVCHEKCTKERWKCVTFGRFPLPAGFLVLYTYAVASGF